MSKIRQPAVAGMFYPDNPGVLQEMVNEYLAAAAPYDGPMPRAVIAPHAGYIYSGPVAGSAFAPWQGETAVNRIILVGPAHTMAISGLAGVSVDAFATPLGLVPVDKEGMDWLRPLPQVHIIDAAHSREHCLEVELPFLQTLFGEFSIVPLLAGDTSGAKVAQILTLFADDPTTRIVISSDLSHYHDYHTARRLDAATAQAITHLQPEELGYDSACGRIPIQGLLAVAKREGWRATAVDLRNSGDTAGPKDRVVGYGAFVFA